MYRWIRNFLVLELSSNYQVENSTLQGSIDIYYYAQLYF